MSDDELNRRVAAQIEPLPAEGEVDALRSALEAAKQARERLLATPHGRSRGGERSAAHLQTAIGDLERQVQMMERASEPLDPGGTVRLNMVAGANGIRGVEATFLGVDPADGWIVLKVDGKTHREHRLTQGDMYGLFWEERVRIERWLAKRRRLGQTTLPRASRAGAAKRGEANEGSTVGERSPGREAEEILALVRANDRPTKRSQQIAIIYERLGDRNQVEVADLFLSSFDPSEFDISVSLSVLTATLRWRHHLLFRSAFYDRVSAYILGQPAHRPDHDKLMDGLR